MNDYKELIEILRDDEYCGKLDFVYDAADAIEQLVNERDALLRNLTDICRWDESPCASCKAVHCDACDDGYEYWEWRVAQEASK